MGTLAVGDLAPDFTLEADDAKTVTLSALRPHKVVLYVYPAAFTAGCSLEAQDFRDADKPFEDAGYKVFGISPDSPEKNRAFAQDLRLPFELLSDPDHKVLEEYGAWGEKTAFGRTKIGVIRSTFVIGSDGRLTVVEYNVRAAGHVERLAAELGVPWP
ncbi:MAG: peroxiredoxin [Bifidobacteriaceae bacterium]|jgi:peroxiredoxin Q/BCP|nr:peroxiredoxin [Bifidobacteriaceae bacterium]